MLRSRLTALSMAMLSVGDFVMNPAIADNLSPITVNQGDSWTAATRADFYIQDQGSRIVPLSWLSALKLPDGRAFLFDALARYGYLPNPANSNGLPVGFSSSGSGEGEIVGMTCAACHTRQIIVGDNAYRIDGGPAIVDFQAFLYDLDTSFGIVLSDEHAFEIFATGVLGHFTAGSNEVDSLRDDLKAWYERYHALMTGARPTTPWGIGRLDAVGMIFNRLAGLDLGPLPSRILSENFRHADAPVRYPFLWNAPIQDHTQWAGFAGNGSDLLGLTRNLGEVYGVFGVFQPKQSGWHILGVDYWNNNSANFDGLEKLETLVKNIGAPKWPWSIDNNLADQGRIIFNRAKEQGGCADCHGVQDGQTRFFNNKTWKTPLVDVVTDRKQYEVLKWTATTGVLQDAEIPFLSDPLNASDDIIKILKTSVAGTIIQYYAPVLAQRQAPQSLGSESFLLPPELQDLKIAFNIPSVKGPVTARPEGFVYEARVLQGIWAAAPYLHNGSVPTLVELLKPWSERVDTFKVGPAYDPSTVGLAIDQPNFSSTMHTTDCNDLSSGNSRCGHEWGTTQLTPKEKEALLEYLKRL